MRGVKTGLCGILLLWSVLAYPAEPVSKQLVLLNWSEYMDPALLQKFRQLHGVDVKEVYYSNDDERDSMLALSNATGYDLIVVNGSMLAAYKRKGWLAKIPNPAPTNLRHVEPRWRKAFAAASSHAVPVLWGTMGIAYRSDLLSQPVLGWDTLFKLDPSTSQRIGMVSTVRELMGAALKSLGYSLNSTDRREIAEAARLLERQRPAVDSYLYSKLSQNAPLVRGEQVASIMYNGDAMTLQQFNPDIRFVLPKEGGNLWIDHIVVASSSRRSELAWQFVNFLCEPENAAQWAQFAYTATTNTAANQFLPEEFKRNSLINPDADALQASEWFEPLPPRILNRINSLVLNVVEREPTLSR